MKLIFATRPSALARWQTNWVRQALERAWPGLKTEEVIITTSGDRILDRPLPEIGGKGLFTQELEIALLSEEVQAAVHSLKDLPVEAPPGLAISATPVRSDVRDALISAGGFTLDSLPQGSRIGTSSLRRAAQIRAYRPDLVTSSLRGNVDTRLRKALEGQYDAIVLAGAGLLRLGLAEHVTQWLPLELVLPAPGQGALAVQCRSEDAETVRLLSAIHDPVTALATQAERAFLNALGGGCAVPVAAYAQVENGTITLQGRVSALDGQTCVQVAGQGSDPKTLGADLARQAVDQGAGHILSAIQAASLK